MVLAVLAALALTVLVLPLATPGCGTKVSNPGGVVPAPTSEEIALYVRSLSMMLQQNAAKGMASATPTRAAITAIAMETGFPDLETYARVQASVLSGYACLQAEQLRDELAVQLESAPPGLAEPLRRSVRKIDGRIEVLRRKIAPETLPRLRPFLSELDQLLGARPNLGIVE
jgi:hypothetical protein